MQANCNFAIHVDGERDAKSASEAGVDVAHTLAAPAEAGSAQAARRVAHVPRATR